MAKLLSSNSDISSSQTPPESQGSELMKPSRILVKITFEIVLPLFIMLLPLAVHPPLLVLINSQFYLITIAVSYAALLPINTALLQRIKTPEKKRWDLYLLALIELFVISAVLWIPAIVIEAGFCALFYILIKILNLRFARLSFLGLYLVATVLILLSGLSPVSGRHTIFLAIMIMLGLYLLIIGRERFLVRPKVGLTLGMLYLTFISFYIHGIGGRTAWMTSAVVKQKGVELLLPPRQELTGPRAVIPVKNGLLIYTNLDKFALVSDKGLKEFSPPFKVGRVDIPVCDPEDDSTCYIPARNRGIAILNTSSWEMASVNFKPFPYDLVVADQKRDYLAVLNDSKTHVAIAKRIAPGRLEKIADMNTPGRTCLIDFVGQKLILVTRAKKGSKRGLYGFAYNIDSRRLEGFMKTKDPIVGRKGWCGAIADGKLFVITMVNGMVYVLDMNGKRLGESYLVPLLRHIVYDPQRRLCYIVSDLGFIFMYDPWHSKTVRTLFLGFKTKNIYHEGSHLYIGSTAGIFRIDIDKAISDRNRLDIKSL